jgi:hypothetical protein
MTEIEELRKEVAELKERVELMDMLRDLQKRIDEYNKSKPYIVPMPYPVYPHYPRLNEPWITYTTTGMTYCNGNIIANTGVKL